MFAPSVPNRKIKSTYHTCALQQQEHDATIVPNLFP